MKEGVLKDGRVAFLCLILLGSVLTISFVLAAHVITTSTGGTSYSVDEDVGFIYNITVNNTDTTAGANITGVNITIPSTFSFIADSNATDAGTHTFTNTSTVLSWENDGLVMNLTWKYFSFNASASTPGDYNFSVVTTNSSGTSTSNISITINDTTVPEVQEANFSSPVTSGNYSGTLVLNVSIIDNGVLDTVFFNITNSSGQQNATSTASNPSGNVWNASIDTSGFPDGVYNITVFANDTYNNLNNSARVHSLKFDNTNPSPTASCSPSSVSTGATFPCSCSASDATSDVQTTSSSSTSPENTGTPATAGTFTYTCSATDYAGNTASSTASYTVTSGGGTSSSSGGGATTWSNTFVEDDKELESKGIVTKQLSSKQRVKLKVGGETHYVGVLSVSSDKAEVEISSTPQKVTLLIGESKKFNVDDDNSYDLLVVLNSITNNKADLAISEINEEIPSAQTDEGSSAQTDEGEAGTGEETSQNVPEGKSRVGIVIAVILVILILVGVAFFVWKKNKDY